MASRHLHWVGGTAQWNGTAGVKWSLTSGGAGGEAEPTLEDDVTFDLNSGVVTVNVFNTAVCRNLSFTSPAGDFAGTFTGSANLTIAGSLTVSPTTTLTSTSALTFSATSAQTITTNGVALDNALTFDGVAGSWALQDALTSGPTRRVLLTNGTLDLNNQRLKAGFFQSSNSNVRVLAFGASGEMDLAANNTTVWTTATNTNFSITGTPVVNATYAGATGTRTFTSGTATEAKAVSVNVKAGTDTVTFASYFRSLDFTGFSGTLTNDLKFLYGGLRLSAGMTLSAGTNTTRFDGTAGPYTIESNGRTMDFPLTFAGAGGAWTLADALSLGSTRTLTLSAGTLNANGKSVSIGAFALGAGTKTLTMGGGVWSCAGGWDAATNVANLTVNPAGTIDMTSGSAKTFAGGGKAWPTLNQGGAGALTISGSNTFADITATTLPSTISFTDGTTQTVDRFTARGQPGALLTLGPTGAGTWSIGKAGGGPVNSDYLSVSKSIALYRDWFAGRNSTDGGGNTGWRFTPYSSLIPLILPRRR